MVWFWKRDNEELRVETRYDNATQEFIVTLQFGNGATQSERFARRSAFEARLIALERDLGAERWASTGPPQFLPDGFPRRPGEVH
jgi:hypothetical protein